MNTNNDHLILIAGASATGKSASLIGLANPEGVIYLRCEPKKLPFKTTFKEFVVTDTQQVYQAFAEAENIPDVHTIVIDSLTFLMDMYESTKVLNSANSMKEWGNYAQYLKVMMSQLVAKSTKNVIFTAHTMNILNEAEMVTETLVKVKGSLMSVGIESFFSTVISTKRMPLSKLTDLVADSSMFTITEDEEIDKFKYVFQTRLTKDTVNERIRSPLGMWSRKETYIDNNVQFVLNRLHTYYK